MPIQERLELYRRLEKKRQRPLLVYVTSNRVNAQGQMAADAIPELLAQLQKLDRSCTAIDLLIVSHGGDPTVAWRLVSLIRERVKSFSVLVPQAAYSAATLVALGADEIVIHPHGNLGPVDPQITVSRPNQEGGQAQVRFGSEDLAAFLRFIRSEVGLTDQEQVRGIFEFFCREVGAVPIGVATRGAQLSVAMGEKLLWMHMKDGEREKARAIAETLNKKFFHHGYPVSRSEAREIGLKIAASDQETEDLLWEIWLDIEKELMIREPFSPTVILRQTPGCEPLFAPTTQITMPSNLPPEAAQQVLNQLIGKACGVISVAPAPYRTILALVESCRLITHSVNEGFVYAARMPDLQLQVSIIPERSGWVTVPLPEGACDVGN